MYSTNNPSSENKQAECVQADSKKTGFVTIEKKQCKRDKSQLKEYIISQSHIPMKFHDDLRAAIRQHSPHEGEIVLGRRVNDFHFIKIQIPTDLIKKGFYAQQISLTMSEKEDKETNSKILSAFESGEFISSSEIHDEIIKSYLDSQKNILDELYDSHELLKQDKINFITKEIRLRRYGTKHDTWYDELKDNKNEDHFSRLMTAIHMLVQNGMQDKYLNIITSECEFVMKELKQTTPYLKKLSRWFGLIDFHLKSNKEEIVYILEAQLFNYTKDQTHKETYQGYLQKIRKDRALRYLETARENEYKPEAPYSSELLNLPPDILLHVLDQLASEANIKTGNTCKYLYHITSQDSLWKKHVEGLKIKYPYLAKDVRLFKNGDNKQQYFAAIDTVNEVRKNVRLRELNEHVENYRNRGFFAAS